MGAAVPQACAVARPPQDPGYAQGLRGKEQHQERQRPQRPGGPHQPKPLPQEWGQESPQGLYGNFIDRHSDDDKRPLNAVRALSTAERSEMKRAAVKGAEAYQLDVALFTQASKKNAP